MFLASSIFGPYKNMLWIRLAVTFLLMVKQTQQLNFEAALEDNKFVDISSSSEDGHASFSASYYLKDKSHNAFMLDKSYSSVKSEQYRNYSISIGISDEDCQKQLRKSGHLPYNLELSLTIIKLSFGGEPGEEMEDEPQNLLHPIVGEAKGKARTSDIIQVTVVSDRNAEKTFPVLEERRDPMEAKFKHHQSLFQTWESRSGIHLLETDPFSKRIHVTLDLWHPNSSIYMVATVHKLTRLPTDECPDYTLDFQCVSPVLYGVRRNQLCIANELLCNDLPNCAQEEVLNTEERDCLVNQSIEVGLLVSFFGVISIVTAIIAALKYVLPWYMKHIRSQHSHQPIFHITSNGGPAQLTSSIISGSSSRTNRPNHRRVTFRNEPTDEWYIVNEHQEETADPRTSNELHVSADPLYNQSNAIVELPPYDRNQSPPPTYDEATSSNIVVPNDAAVQWSSQVMPTTSEQQSVCQDVQCSFEQKRDEILLEVPKEDEEKVS